MYVHVESFKEAAKPLLEKIQAMSAPAGQTILEWLDLLSLGNRAAADQKLLELPKISLMSGDLLEALADLFVKAMEYNLSVPR